MSDQGCGLKPAGAPVSVAFGLPPIDTAEDARVSLDALDVDIDCYGPPEAGLIELADDDAEVNETLHNVLLKSNCPVTGKPN